MTAANPFIWELDQYQRNLDFVDEGIAQFALYLSRMSGDSIEQTTTFIKQNLSPDGAFPLKNPAVRYLERNKYGDRELKEGTFLQYLDMVDQRKGVMPPTMTVYIPPTEKVSILGEYADGNVAIRSKFKKLKFEAQQRGDRAVADTMDGLQNSKKIFNNSISGGHSSPSTPLYNRTAHSTLTSGCRITTGYGNANNEKFIAGNRHYWSFDVATANILTIVRHTDYVALARAIELYDLYLPTTEEVMVCISRSSNYYWRNADATRRIQELVSALTPIERAAFLYIGDFYHFAKHNDAPVRSFLRDLIQVTSQPIALAEADRWLGAASQDMKVFINLLCSEWTADRNIKDIRDRDPEQYGIIGANAKNVVETLERYRPLIEGVMRPATLHGSINRLPSIIRRAVIGSDTDSTIFTTQHWTRWYVGKLDFSIESYRIGYAITYLTSQIVAHLLAMKSAQVGMARHHITRLEMKNEYYFPVFILTSRSKHYAGCRSAQEGNVFKTLKPEIKGVELRSSNAPKYINDRLHELIKEMIARIMTDMRFSLHDLLDPIYEIERSIVDDIKNGGHQFLRTIPLKDSSAYVEGENAPSMLHHRLWQSVFAPKYGAAPELPYQGVKVNVMLDNPTKFNSFIASIPDRALATRLEAFCKQNNRTKIAIFVFPKSIIEQCNVPLEVLPVIESRKLIYSIMSPYYLFLESFGIYMINPRQTRLLSDTWVPRINPTALIDVV